METSPANVCSTTGPFLALYEQADPAAPCWLLGFSPWLEWSAPLDPPSCLKSRAFWRQVQQEAGCLSVGSVPQAKTGHLDSTLTTQGETVRVRGQKATLCVSAKKMVRIQLLIFCREECCCPEALTQANTLCCWGRTAGSAGLAQAAHVHDSQSGLSLSTEMLEAPCSPHCASQKHGENRG